MAEVDGRYNRGMALDYNNIASFTSFTYQPLGEFCIMIWDLVMQELI